MKDAKEIKQYGLWSSPITPVHLAQGLNLTDIAWDDDGSLVWREVRSGKGVLVIKPADGQARWDLNSEYPTRGFVGYGGGEFAVAKGKVFFVEGDSGRIYVQPIESGLPKPITPAFGGCASPTVSPDGKYLLYVHTYERKDSIAIVDTEGKVWPQKIVEGDDFYMQPRWDPKGEYIAWIAWNHPNMPWDGTRLRIGMVEKDKSLLKVKKVTEIAGDDNISIFQPEFSPDGRFLAYVSDESGWWQIYLYDLETKEHKQVTFENAEHGVPAWIQGNRTYAFSPDGKRLFFTQINNGESHLWEVDLNSGKKSQLNLGDEYQWLEQVTVSPSDGRIGLLASGGSIPKRVITYLPGEGSRIECRSMPEDVPEEIYASPRAINWKGKDDGEVHGIYYSPQNPRYQGRGLPPLMVLIHGGPTSQRGMHFDSQVQFFTTRGYAVLQVNYRGSTGYGREYRDALKGNWGIYDVEDAVSGAQDLANQGLVDGKKIVIMGGSAGGFTVLKALEDYPGFFKAGICLYGVSNQFTLVADTHKFEERYSDSLIGSLPDAADIYRERSPVFFADRIRDAIIFFQGEDDKVVPKNQSDTIVEAIRRNGVPCEYHIYPGEGHGFRKSETIEHFYHTILRFLEQYVVYRGC
ncbi:MAG TPA: S9 family peptidase [Anaerolineae bacterium]|nr:S9 family peptidase [Anaerolineae bacterium]